MSTSVFADTGLTLDNAINNAISESETLSDLNDAIDNLKDNYNGAKAQSINMEKTVREVNDYTILDALDRGGVELTEDQEDDLDHYKSTYGPVPPRFPRETWLQMNLLGIFLPYELENMYESMKVNYEKAELGIEYQTSFLYYNLSNLEEMIKVQNEYLDILEKQANNAESKFKLGLISEIELFRAKSNFTNQKLSIENLEYTCSNLEMQLNLLMGKDLLTNYSYSANIVIPSDEINEYAVYLDESVINSKSLELANSKNELLEEKYDFYSKSGDDRNEDVLNVKISAIDAKYELIKTRNDLDSSVYTQYSKIVDQFESLENAKSNYELAISNYKNILVSKNTGLVDEVTASSVEFQKNMARIQLLNEYRIYNLEISYFNNLLENGLF